MIDSLDIDKLPDVSNTVLAHRLKPRRRKTIAPAAPWAMVPIGVAALAGLAAIPSSPKVGSILAALSLLAASGNLKIETTEEPLDSLEGYSWEALVRALIESPSKLERNHLFAGWYVDDPGVPALIPIDSMKAHCAVNCGSGEGKSTRFVLPIARQLIMRNRYSVIVVNNKGTSQDIAEFEVIRREAERAGLPFRYLTTREDRSTHVWDVFEKDMRAMFRPALYANFIFQGMGLEFKEDHGASFWMAMNKDPLRLAVEEYRDVLNFRVMARMLSDETERERLGLTSRRIQNAAHLKSHIEALAQVRVLNPSQDSPGYEYGISMLEAITTPCVYYLDLAASVDGDTSKFISRTLLRMITAAARYYEGPRVPVFVFFEEAQEFFQRSLLTPLKHARDSGLHFVFTFQDRSDLKNADVDLTGNMDSNTVVKVSFSARDKDSREFLSFVSGETTRKVKSRGRSISTMPDGSVAYVESEQEGEVITPRIQQNEINELNRHPGRAYLQVAPNEGFSVQKYPSLIHMPHGMTKREFERLGRKPWPKVEPGVTVLGRDVVVYDPAPPAPPEPPVPSPAPKPQPTPEPKPSRKRGPTPEQQEAAREAAERLRQAVKAQLNAAFGLMKSAGDPFLNPSQGNEESGEREFPDRPGELNAATSGRSRAMRGGARHVTTMEGLMARKPVSEERTVFDEPVQRVAKRGTVSSRQDGLDRFYEIRSFAIWSELLWRRYWLGFVCGFGSSMVFIVIIWREVTMTIADYCGVR